MAAAEEIAIKLGINVGDFKAALADANASVKKLKKEGDGDFMPGLKAVKKQINDFKDILVAGGIATAVQRFFALAIETAEKTTDATNTNAAAVRDFAKGLEEVKGVAGTLAVTTVGAFNKLGSAIGDVINIGRSFIKNGTDGFEVWARNEDMIASTGKAAEEVEARLAAVRKKNGAEFLAITKELADIEKKRQDQQLQGLTVYETESNLTKKLSELRAKAASSEGEAIDKRRLALQIAQTQLELDKVNLAVRKERAAEEKKAAEEEAKAMAEFAKAAEERRKEMALAAEMEATLFALRKKSADEAEAQGKAELDFREKQNAQIERQMEITRLRAKLTESLAPAEQKQLAVLAEQRAELQKQIAQKQALITASNNRSPIEEALLKQLQAQSAALAEEVKGLEARAGVTANFTDAEAKFLAQLVEQKRSIFEQIDLLEKRAAIPNTLTKEEEALLVPLREQGRTYLILIDLIKQRFTSGSAQTAEELEYLDALKSSATTLVNQIEALKARNAASLGMSETEAKTLAGYQAQSAALEEQIAALQHRVNSSGGISEIEADTLATWERENSVLKDQIVTMTARQGATGDLAANESVVLAQWEEQQKALLEQIDTMRNRKDVTDEQRAADLARLATLLAGTKAIDEQKDAIERVGTVTRANLDATKQMTAADKETLAILELKKREHELIIELKKLDEKIQKDGINEDLKDARLILQGTLDDTQKQLDLKQRVSIGIKEDLELYKLQSKASKDLTTADVERLQALLKMREEKKAMVAEEQRQLDIVKLHALVLSGDISPAQLKELETLQKQSEEYQRQVKIKGDQIKATADHGKAEEGVTTELDSQGRVIGRLITERERAILVANGIETAEQRVTAELQRQLDIAKARQVTITNQGNEQNLTDTQLQNLITKLGRDIELIKASNFGGFRDTAEQLLLQVNLDAAKREQDLRKSVERAIDFWGSDRAQVHFAPNDFARISQLINPDATARIDRNTQSIAVSLDKLANETARSNRIPPLVGPTTR